MTKIFGKLPSQFLQYFSTELNRLNNSGKDGIKNELIERINAQKGDSKYKGGFYDKFFEKRRRDFLDLLVARGFSKEEIQHVRDTKIAAENINLICEMIAQRKQEKLIEKTAKVSMAHVTGRSLTDFTLTRNLGKTIVISRTIKSEKNEKKEVSDS